MKHRYICRLIATVIILVMLPVTASLAWTEQAHMAMGLAAGFARFQDCAAVDIARTIAKINNLTQTDGQAHFFNATDDYVLTVDDAYTQLQHLGQSATDCPDGYLLGAILQTTRICKEKTAAGVYDDEYYATLLHYVADLAQPLHVSFYDDFNRSFHFVSDDILSDTEAVYPVFAAVSLADELTVDDTLVFETEEQLLEAVIALAERSQKLAGTMRAEQRNITREEALLQVSQAASLGRAIMKYCGKELVGDNEAEAADMVLYGTVYTAEDETDSFANNRNTGTP